VTNGANRVHIAADGKVGINNTNPTELFHINNGAALITTSTGGSAIISGPIGTLNFWEGNNISGNADTTRLGVGRNNTALIFTNSSGILRTAFAIGTSAAEPLLLSTNSTEQVRITSDRYLRMASGTGGIQFGGDTAVANALHDYEEGTWTPALGNLAGTDITIGTDGATPAVFQGRYVKVGRFALVKFRIAANDNTVTAGTGQLALTGVPLAPRAVRSGGAMAISRGFTSGNCPMTAFVAEGDTRIFFTLSSEVSGSAGAFNKGASFNSQAVTGVTGFILEGSVAFESV
jgi:hypothetical protein